ncbi:restriction endonuclease subunit S [Salmonella enterica]|nr:restriction endonuclease subunit S [Salmonella enterica subsp. enterica serovar Warnow]ECG7889188.1 restriction endonuclease subunit S [Salmonella enterica subsp. enterica serovar Takoradi]EDS6598871.1 restriction endonuclease subunit S [Salmonella enterica subsp. enterica]EHS4894035.1 restriction endonuclease subunit S [Salmonella enterica]EBR0104841.1 restriction endonuclease subunit S [Salmonella enterica subsp. enterica serovar Warnow]
MGSKWGTLKLSEFAFNASRRFDFKNKEKVVFINTGDVSSGKFLHKKLISSKGLPGQAKKAIRKGDILFSEIRPNNNRFALVDFDDCDNFVVSTKFMVLDVNQEIMDLEFFYLLLTTPKTLSDFQHIAESRSGTFPQITFDAISHYPFPFPDKKNQLLIKKVLLDITNKIEICSRINQSLEQMSQTLFKSWFVDFDPVIDNALNAGNPIPEALQSRAELRQKVRNSADFKPLPADIRALFPAEFEETELGCIPKGWNIDNVGGLSENIFSGGTPNTSTEEYWNGALNWFSSGETRNAIIIETEKKITEAGVKNSSTRLSVSGDILIASAGQGHTRGQTSLNTIDTYINQSVVCIRPMKSYYSSWLYFNISSRYEEMRAISDSHSIRGSLTTKLIASMKVISPTDNLISLFDTSCSTFIRKMRNNLQLSCELKKLRDTLLPKLISGELSLEDLPNLASQTEPS